MSKDIGRLGIDFFGGQDDGSVRATLGLVAGDDVAMAAVTKLGSYDGSFASVNRAIGVELRDRDDTTVGPMRRSLRRMRSRSPKETSMLRCSATSILAACHRGSNSFVLFSSLFIMSVQEGKQ